MNQVFEAYQRSSWERFCISTPTATFRTAVWPIAWNAGRPGTARGYGAGGDLATSCPRELPTMWGWRASGSLASCPGGMASSAAASLPPLTPPPPGLAGWLAPHCAPHTLQLCRTDPAACSSRWGLLSGTDVRAPASSEHWV